MKLWSPPDGTKDKKAYLEFDEIEKKYGLFIAQLCNTYEKNSEAYPPELAKSMWRIHNGTYPKMETREDWSLVQNSHTNLSKTKPCAAGSTKKKRIGLHYNNGIIQSGAIWRALRTKSEIMVYMTLNAFIVRGQMSRDEHNLYKDFYKKRNLLACAKTYDEIVNKTGLSRKSVRDALHRFEEDNLIFIKKGAERKGAALAPNIYILGQVDRDGNEVYYIDKVINDQFKK